MANRRISDYWILRLYTLNKGKTEDHLTSIITFYKWRLSRKYRKHFKTKNEVMKFIQEQINKLVNAGKVFKRIEIVVCPDNYEDRIKKRVRYNIFGFGKFEAHRIINGVDMGIFGDWERSRHIWHGS